MNDILGIVMIITFVVCIVLAIWTTLKVKWTIKKNKMHYDLREVMFYLDPLDDGTYMLRFKYGEKLVFQERVTPDDIYINATLPFKLFVGWCEEDYGGN